MKTKKLNKVSIIIPVYNEESNFKEIYHQLLDSIVPIHQKTEIVIIDDGSSDNSQKIVAECYLENKEKFKNQILISHIKNSGKGSALKTGFKCCTGEAVIIQDADLEYHPDELVQIINKYDLENKDGTRFAIYGSRYFDFKNKKWNKKHKDALFLSYFGGMILTFFTNLFLKTKITDVLTCYKIFPTSLIKNYEFKEMGFGFELEITNLIIKNGLEIKETSIHHYKPRLSYHGKKFKAKEGLRILFRLPKILTKKIK